MGALRTACQGALTKWQWKQEKQKFMEWEGEEKMFLPNQLLQWYYLNRDPSVPWLAPRGCAHANQRNSYGSNADCFWRSGTRCLCQYVCMCPYWHWWSDRAMTTKETKLIITQHCFHFMKGFSNTVIRFLRWHQIGSNALFFFFFYFLLVPEDEDYINTNFF